MSNRRITKDSTNKEGEFNLVKGTFPYHNREDRTTLPGNVLVSPSKNVINNFGNRLQLVKGYVVDGQTSTVIDSGILSNFDFIPTRASNVRNMRAGFLTSAGNDGKLQYRYKNPDDTITWRDLQTGLPGVVLSFTGEYWDTTEKLKLLLWIDGSNNVYEWNGTTTTFASATTTTITKQGTQTWAQTGFYVGRDKKVVIDGIVYTYTGGETTTTLTGVTPDPTLGLHTVGDVIHQQYVTNALSGMTAIDPLFGPTVIGCGRQNQVYLGSIRSNDCYISKVNDFTDFAYTSPVRVAGEGFLLTLDDPAIKFVPQEVYGNQDAYDMWISMGKDRWAIVRSTLSGDNAKERLDLIRLKSAPLQGTMTERLCAKMKNHIIFIGNDNVLNAMGYMSYQYVPVMQDLSYPIINDMNSYDFSNGSVFFHKNYIFVAIPAEGIIRMYNMTDQTTQQYSNYGPIEDIDSKNPFFWEAPIGYPMSGFYEVDGEIYGHGFNTSESYKLFEGGSFNGQEIDANATLATTDLGDRTQSKGSNEVWVEGYIKQNTILACTVSGDLDSFMTSQTVFINGADAAIVALGGGAGKSPLGTDPLGGVLGGSGSGQNGEFLPAWFHVSKTYVQQPYYLETISFNTKGIDLQWELLTWGTNARFTNEGNNHITQ
jgi:hypothetical protein